MNEIIGFDKWEHEEEQEAENLEGRKVLKMLQTCGCHEGV